MLRKYFWWIAAGTAVTAAVVWAIVISRSSSQTVDGSGLLVGDVTGGVFDDCIRLQGKVEAGTTVQLSALESGIVERKWVEEGAMVNPGDIIVTLVNPNLRQQILDSESQLAEKQNMLRDTEIAMEKECLQIRRDLLSARTDLGRCRRVAEQQEALYRENLTSREEYLRAREDYELAQENLQLLNSRLHQDSLYRGVQIAMMRESLHNMQENFALVRSRADNLNIRASHAGQLGSFDVELGQSISAGQLVGLVNILDDHKISVGIDEHYIERVVPGLSAHVNRNNGDTLCLTVRKVYPEVNNGVFKADLAIEGSSRPDRLRVGQTFPVELSLGESSEAVLLPKGAFFQSTGGRWIYVLDNDGKSAHRREIKIGRQNPRYYEVVEGLRPGERVVLNSYTSFGGTDRLNIKK